jgi:hypothetical protein
MAPASNDASTRREKCPAKVNPDWLHSVIAKAVLLLALTVDWKLSYATKDGLLPMVCEKSGLDFDFRRHSETDQARRSASPRCFSVPAYAALEATSRP